MNDTLLLIGSLSNDLLRVANLTQRGSLAGAKRFRQEAKRWAKPLTEKRVKRYIREIAVEVTQSEEEIDMALAEKYLMFGILLQNYALHTQFKSD